MLQKIWKIIIIFSIFLTVISGYYDKRRKIFIRKNVKYMTEKEWDSFMKGVEVMKSRDDLDPTSIVYQSRIHGWSDRLLNPEENAKRHWSECQHGQFYFLPWHRMYLAMIGECKIINN